MHSVGSSLYPTCSCCATTAQYVALISQGFQVEVGAVECEVHTVELRLLKDRPKPKP